MGLLQIWDKNGNALSLAHGRFTNISESIASKFVVHKLPGADKDIIQKLGTGNKTYIIEGYTTHFYGSQWLHTLPNNTGSIYMSGSALGQSFDHIQVFFYDVQIKDVGGRVGERNFTIRAIEVI